MYAILNNEKQVERLILDPTNVEIDRYNVISDLREVAPNGLASMGIYPVIESKNKGTIDPSSIKINYVFDQKENVVVETIDEGSIDIEKMKVELLKNLGDLFMYELRKTDAYVLHAHETQQPISKEVQEERSEIRSRYSELIKKAEKASSLDDIIKLTAATYG